MRHLTLGLCCSFLFFGQTDAATPHWEDDAGFAPVLEQTRAYIGIVQPVPLPDGGVLVSAPYVNGVRTSGLTRLSADGAVDPTFASSSEFSTDEVSFVYPDGRLLVCVTKSDTAPGRLYRLDRKGAIDPSFNVPELDVQTSSISRPGAMIQPDGKILLWGKFTTISGKNRVGLARFYSDGGLDESFVTPFLQENTEWICDVDLQTDGRIVVAGQFLPGPSVVRLKSDGSRDSTFDATDTWGTQSARWVRVLPSGLILAVSKYSWGILTRLLPNGAKDPTYAPTLFSEITGAEVTRPTASGRIHFIGQKAGLVVGRLTPEGIIDPGFNVVSYGIVSAIGIYISPVTWDETYFFTDGLVTDERYRNREILTKLDSSGATIAEFTPRFSGDARLSFIGRLADGRYLLSGEFDHVNGVKAPSGVARLHVDGSLDTTLQTDRLMTVVAVEPDGHFIAKGDFGSSRLHARLNADGTIASIYDETNGPHALTVGDDAGRLYSQGADSPATLDKYLPNGKRDPAFSASLSGRAIQLCPAPDGKLFVVTENLTPAPQVRLLRLLANGQLDTTFPAMSLPDRQVVLTPLADGSIIVIRQLSNGSWSYALRYDRYDTTGKLVSYHNGVTDRYVMADVVLDYLLATNTRSASFDRSAYSSNDPSFPERMYVSRDGAALFAAGTIFSAGRLTRAVLTTDSPGIDQPPTVITHPTATTVTTGSLHLFSVTAAGPGPFTYVWRKNGVPLATQPGESVLVLRDVQPADAGAYSVVVSNPWGKATSGAAMLTVTATGAGTTTGSRLVNLSVRSRAGTADKTLIMGFVVSGSGAKPLLLRGVGPLLSELGVTDALSDPQLKLFSGAAQVDGNDNWDTALSTTFAAVGAIALPPASKDAALLRTSASGPFTVHVTSATAATGIALVEVYDVDKTGGRLVNISARSEARAGDDILIAGFVLEGTGARTLLLRGVGPTLSPQGVAGALLDPALKLFNRAGVEIGQNNDWGGTTELKTVFTQVGAAAFLSDVSKDAALLVTLNPGVYTVHVYGVNNTTGVALVEIYEVP